MYARPYYTRVAEFVQCSALVQMLPPFRTALYVPQVPVLAKYYSGPMKRFHPAALLVLPLGLLLLRSLPSYGQRNDVLQPEEACADFAGGGYPGSSWTMDNCIDVWTRYARTVPSGLQRRLNDVDIWREAASELRRVGSPCLVASEPTSDGAGSSTIRHLATWIFAEEMGCDWVTPDWGKRPVDGGNGTVMYCHRTATTQEMDLSKPNAELQALRRCSVIDWLAYFQFDVPSVSRPEGGETKVIKASAHDERNWSIIPGLCGLSCLRS